MEPRVSVIVAAYKPGDGFDRVIGSLDAQTLPQDEFELIVVDDGSPDDTFERLSALAATRPNMRVEQIENSGWPSRPRNVGTDLARAPYVLFMDHDDSLYPDALRRLVEYADEHGADVVNAKESQTRGIWWGTAPFRHGNIPNIVPGGDIHQLMPMIPHKLFRKAFLEEHGIRFPRGGAQLWEDIFFNVEAWRHAKVISLLADTPAYLWHLTEANNSSTYGPGGMEFWNRLDVLYEFIDRTLDGDEFARARQDEFLHQWRSRALKRFSKLAGTATEERTLRTLPRAQSLQARYIPVEQEPLLGMITRPHSELVRTGRIDLLGRMWQPTRSSRREFTASNVEWRDGALHADVVARWVGADRKPSASCSATAGSSATCRRTSSRPCPPEAIDVTDTLGDLHPPRRGALARASTSPGTRWSRAPRPSGSRSSRGRHARLAGARGRRSEPDRRRSPPGAVAVGAQRTGPLGRHLPRPGPPRAGEGDAGAAGRPARGGLHEQVGDARDRPGRAGAQPRRRGRPQRRQGARIDRRVRRPPAEGADLGVERIPAPSGSRPRPARATRSPRAWSPTAAPCAWRAAAGCRRGATCSPSCCRTASTGSPAGPDGSRAAATSCCATPRSSRRGRASAPPRRTCGGSSAGCGGTCSAEATRRLRQRCVVAWITNSRS